METIDSQKWQVNKTIKTKQESGGAKRSEINGGNKEGDLGEVEEVSVLMHDGDIERLELTKILTNL